MQKTHPFQSKIAFFLLALAISLSIPACTLSLLDVGSSGNGNGSATQTNIDPAIPTATPVPSAETSITVHLPVPLNEGDVLAISLLDEVTGLALNPTNYPMQAVDAQTYRVSLPLPLNAVIKYRYIVAGNNRAQEKAATTCLSAIVSTK